MKKSVLMLALIAIFLSANVVAQQAQKSATKTEVKAADKPCCDKSAVKSEGCKDKATADAKPCNKDKACADAKPCCKDKANAEAKPCAKDVAKTDAKPCCKGIVDTAKN